MSSRYYFFYAFVFAIGVVLSSVVIRHVFYQTLPLDIPQVISSLALLESSYRPRPQSKPGPSVIVGFGACVDLKVRMFPLITQLGWDPPANWTVNHLRQYDHSLQLNTVDDVILSFASAFVSGAAAERLVVNATLFAEVVQVASNLVPSNIRNRFLHTITSEVEENVSPGRNASPVAWWSLGGNAPVIAVRLAREGAEVSLAARLSPRERTNLPQNIQPLTAPANFGLPETPGEDVHLIMEYEAGERWGDLVSPRANRFIILRDEETPRLSSLWPNLLETWRHNSASRPEKQRSTIPDVFVLGGLQVMDNWGFHDVQDIRPSRLTELEIFLISLPAQTLIHFEMASFVNRDFANMMIQKVMPHVDSVGLNEQELPNLASLLVDGQVTSISSSYPRAAHMLDTMRTVWALLNDPQLPRVGRRRLSRIHLHTIAYQLIMVRRHAKGGAMARKELEFSTTSGTLSVRRTDFGLAWPFTKAAAAKASLIANRHTCAQSSIDPVKTRLLMDDSFAVTADAQRWKSALHGKGEGKLKETAGQEPSIPRVHFNATSPVTCWTEPEPDFSGVEGYHIDEQKYSLNSRFDTVIEICVSPVLVCSVVKQTVGAGDNISAGALRAQITTYRSSES